MSMNRVELAIEFTGITREFAAGCVARYFNTEAKNDDGEFVILDSMRREWNFFYAETVRPIIDTSSINTDEYDSDIVDEYRNQLIVSEFYPGMDMDTLHDVLVILKACGAVVNELCSMHVTVSCPIDQRMAGCILSEYCKVQESQIEAFKTSASYITKCAKLYPIVTDGYEIDNYTDVVRYVESTYAPVPNFDEEFASKYALNFLSASMYGKLEFRAFNATFDSNYVTKAIDWVKSFMSLCETVYNNNWLSEYEKLRA